MAVAIEQKPCPMWNMPPPYGGQWGREADDISIDIPLAELSIQRALHGLQHKP